MFCRKLIGFLLLSSGLLAAEPVPLQVTEVAPVQVEVRGQVLFADFGKDAYGSLKLEFAGEPPAAELMVRRGEKLNKQGTIDRQPPGSVNYREVRLAIQPGQRVCRLAIPGKPFHRGKASVKVPVTIELNGTAQVGGDGKAITLRATGPTDTNSIAEPTKIVPVAEPLKNVASGFSYTFPAWSITVLELAAK